MTRSLLQKERPKALPLPSLYGAIAPSSDDPLSALPLPWEPQLDHSAVADRAKAFVVVVSTRRTQTKTASFSSTKQLPNGWAPRWQRHDLDSLCFCQHIPTGHRFAVGQVGSYTRRAFVSVAIQGMSQQRSSAWQMLPG